MKWKQLPPNHRETRRHYDRVARVVNYIIDEVAPGNAEVNENELISVLAYTTRCLLDTVSGTNCDRRLVKEFAGYLLCIEPNDGKPTRHDDEDDGDD